MAEENLSLMQAHWNNSKAGAPEQHDYNKQHTKMFNEWFGEDMKGVE